MSLDEMVKWLEYLGFTAEKVFPLIAVGGIFAYLFWKFFLRHVKEEITDLHHATKELQMHLKKDDKKWTPQHELGPKPLYSFGRADSPMTPNESGRRLLEDSQFKAQYPKFKAGLFAIMDGHGLRTLYDYESGAKVALDELKNNPEFDPL